jgi:hypothetical protein
MMELNTLRKADIFSGTIIIVLGVFIVVQALQMPMKDSYGGVQNVWYVSPALFPLFIGVTLMVLGCFLVKTAFKAVGTEGIAELIIYLSGPDFKAFLKQEGTIRFYAIVFNLFIFVFILVPRIDFFIAAIIFLLTFFFMFYCGNHENLLLLFKYTAGGSILISLFLLTGLAEKTSSLLPYSGDWFVTASTALLIFTARRKIMHDQDFKKKFRYASVSGPSAKHEIQKVGLDHILKDNDILTIVVYK